MEKRVELLAPCGSYESFLAAVNAGADAVYLGGKAFGARAYAENFSEEELVSVIRQAHLFGVRVYLTVNTLVKQREFPELYGYLRPLYEAGLDGAIVQDMGVFAFIKRQFPDLKLHASTQMTVTGAYGAAYLKKLGCERIVPARELTLQEIRAIKQEVPVEIEAFIHGAMCYCYSGQCLMSSMIGGRSGNRGRCAQPCRLPYKTAGKTGYFLSLKDMNTLEHLPELIEAGIDSFKIEGRMKKPEYVAGVTRVYRKYIDKYYNIKVSDCTLEDDTAGSIKNMAGKIDERREESREKSQWYISAKDKRLLMELYIRSETGSGYYFQSRGAEMLTLQKPGYDEADQPLIKKMREAYIHELPKKVLHFYIRCRAGEPVYGEVRFQDAGAKREVRLSSSGPAALKADKRAVSAKEIRGQIIKTGGTPFVAEKCEVELGEDTFVPMKWIKELRRTLLQKIYGNYGARAVEDRKPEGNEGDESRKEKKTENDRLTVMVQTKRQFEAVFSVMTEAKTDKMKTVQEYLIVDADLLLENEEIRERLFQGKVYWGIKCPLILRKDDEAFLEELKSVIKEGEPAVLYCGTVDVFAWIKSISYTGEIAGEASLYAWNREAVWFWGKRMDRISIPLELDSREIRELCAAAGEPGKGATDVFSGRLEAPVYGRVPFMVSANCIKLSSGRCDKNRQSYAELTDRMGNVFPVYTNCRHCYNIIYNYLPVSYHENLWMLIQDKIRAFRIEFTTESGRVSGEVLQTFQSILASELNTEKSADRRAPGQKKGKIAGMETTQGCFQRRIE